MIFYHYLISPLKERYDVILSAVVSAHRGIILPQIVTTGDVILPFQLSHSIPPPICSYLPQPEQLSKMYW